MSEFNELETDSGYTEDDLKTIDWDSTDMDTIIKAFENVHDALVKFAEAVAETFKPILENKRFMALLADFEDFEASDIFILDTSEEE